MKKYLTKTLCLLLAAVMLLSTAPGVFAWDDRLPGDVNGDGAVTSDDAVYLLRYTLFPKQYPVSIDVDYNDDGLLNSDDAIYLLRSTLFAADYPYETTDYYRGTVRYADMEYVSPDYDAAFGYIDQAYALAENHGDPNEVSDLLWKIDGLMNSYNDESPIIEFMLSCDVTDNEIAEEYMRVSRGNAELYSRYMGLLASLISDPFYEDLFVYYTEEEKEYVLATAETADDEYVELTARLDELSVMYNDPDSCTVEYDGQQVLLGEIEDSADHRAALRRLYGDIYSEIVSTEKALAAKNGYDDVVEYLYCEDYGRDYTADDVRDLVSYVIEYIVPLFNEYVDREKYVDIKVDDVFAYDETFRERFAEMSPTMLDAYDYIRKYGLYVAGDPEYSEDGAYTNYFFKYDTPIIFARESGSQYDVQTFIHEFGHFYAFYYNGGFSSDSLDLCEIHSQANEFLFIPYYAELFGESAAEKLAVNQMIDGLYYLIQATLFAEFELRAFESDCTTYDEITAICRSVIEDFGVDERYFSETFWTYVIHFYVAPLYYISYATSLIPSLQIYSEFVKDNETGIALYNQILENSLYYYTFLEVLDEAGLDSPFSEDAIKDIADMYVAYFGE
ncbi:MAG: hypothetical protein J5760_05180 [Clostridia bacterium]|nr:hypothetical protein [Clostridia bacterium]